MSYSIIYDKQFINVGQTDEGENLYIPFILSGDNNCWETRYRGRDRRARSWHIFSYITDGNVYATKQQMLDSMEDERKLLIERIKKENQEIKVRNERIAFLNAIENPTEEQQAELNKLSKYWKTVEELYSDAKWGWYAALQIGTSATYNTTFRQYQNIVNYGVKNALTLDQLRNKGYRLTYDNSKEDNTYIIPIIDKDDVDKVKASTDFNIYNFHINFWDDAECVRELRNFYFPKPVSNTIIKKEYVVKFNGKYVIKRTKRGIYYSYTFERARKYTLASAKAFVKKAQLRFSDATFEILKTNTVTFNFYLNDLNDKEYHVGTFRMFEENYKLLTDYYAKDMRVELIDEMPLQISTVAEVQRLVNKVVYNK
jgi:hypothetical protein